MRTSQPGDHVVLRHGEYLRIPEGENAAVRSSSGTEAEGFPAFVVVDWDNPRPHSGAYLAYRFPPLDEDR